MEIRKVSGCVFGLKSTVSSSKDLALCKAWGVWTNNASLSRAFDSRHVRCPGGCASVAVSGRNTAHSGAYPDKLALFIKRAIVLPVEDVYQLMREHSESEAKLCPCCSAVSGSGREGDTVTSPLDCCHAIPAIVSCAVMPCNPLSCLVLSCLYREFI